MKGTSAIFATLMCGVLLLRPATPAWAAINTVPAAIPAATIRRRQ